MGFFSKKLENIVGASFEPWRLYLRKILDLQEYMAHNVIPRLPWYFTFVVNIRMVLNWVCNGGVHFVRFILSEIALVVFFMNNPRKYAQVFFKKKKNHLIFTCEVIFDVQLFSVNNQRKNVD